MKKFSVMLFVAVLSVAFIACGDSKDSQVESNANSRESQSIDSNDSQVESGVVSSVKTQDLGESNNKSTRDLAQSSTNPAIAINCDKKEYDYEENSQKCIITGSNSIEEAIKAHLQSEISDDYEVLRRINKTISTIKLPNDNVKMEHQIQVCLDDEITDCELTSMSVIITRKSKDEIVVEYTPSAFYKKTYKQTQNGVEVINESYI
ncbi:hypothetical protein [Helicobacter sp. T3_23-1059]